MRLHHDPEFLLPQIRFLRGTTTAAMIAFSPPTQFREQHHDETWTPGASR